MATNFSFRPYGEKAYHTGTAIPVFSLKSDRDFGIGQFSDIKLLADFCHQAGLDLIQLLPVNDTTVTKTSKDSSPYTAISVFALHPIYLDLEPLIKHLDTKTLKNYEAEKKRLNELSETDYAAVITGKLKYARLAFDAVKKDLLTDIAFKTFVKDRQFWLPAYATFNYLLETFETKDFDHWAGYEKFNQEIFESLYQDDKASDFINFQFYLQYLLHQQLLEASDYCHSLGIALKGDIAIGVGRYSVDAWENPDLFNLDMQAGAPPDAFSTTGQNWALPTYNWSAIEATDFQWWKDRLKTMATYFDAFRLDHILGFFRIWEIPETSVRGLLGHFAPAKGFTVEEIEYFGIPYRSWGGDARFTQPFIKDWVIDRIFGRDNRDMVIQNYLNYIGFENYEIKAEFQDQRVLQELDIDENIRQGLYQLTENVVFIKDHTNPNLYHPRIELMDTISFAEFGHNVQQTLRWMHDDYYYNRNNHFWKEKAFEKLPALITSTDMLACGEDLGMVPTTVPEVMNELKILSLAVERMPSDPSQFVQNLDNLDYLCVATPSTHDTATLRQWWEEDYETSQNYYSNVLHWYGPAPHPINHDVIREIIRRHFDSNAMLVIVPLQDLFALAPETTIADINSERINDPSDPLNNWNYRIHLPLEELLQKTDLIGKISELSHTTRRSYHHVY